MLYGFGLRTKREKKIALFIFRQTGLKLEVRDSDRVPKRRFHNWWPIDLSVGVVSRCGPKETFYITYGVMIP